MRSPEKMGIIELDITNACVHACANCTRFCGHHQKPFFMSFDQFKEAVDSLEGYEGIVGVMGGEPTLHPEFEKFADYIREKRVGKREYLARGPISDMQVYIRSNLEYVNSKVVLLSSIPETYYRHFETINDTFRYQLLNDHRNACEHQALLMSRKELGISDEEWIKKRDACWIQNTWSATITPKGAFFCEIAGALDMLFDGPGGWPVEKGWFKRKPEDFGDQLQWCELCSACLDVPKRLSNDERDDITPGMLEKLKNIQSPRIEKGQFVVRDPERFEEYRDATYSTGSEYIRRGKYIRSAPDNRNLYPKDVVFINREHLCDELRINKPKDWIVIGGEGREDDIRRLTEDYIFNPGCCYIIDDDIVLFNVMARSIRDALRKPETVNADIPSYYPKDKRVSFSMDDLLLPILGGDVSSLKERVDHIQIDSFLVYGAGKIGTEVVDFLEKKNITDFDVVVTENKDRQETVCGHPVHELSEFVEIKDKVVVILAASEKNQKEMVIKLRELGFPYYQSVMQKLF